MEGFSKDLLERYTVQESKNIQDLYHYTSLHKASKILEDNVLKANAESGWMELPKKYAHKFVIDLPYLRDKTNYLMWYISTTRDLNWYKRGGGLDYPVRFVLDGVGLTENYKIVPYNFWRGKTTRPSNELGIFNESEERIILPKGKKGVPNFNKYIKSIDILVDVLEESGDLDLLTIRELYENNPKARFLYNNKPIKFNEAMRKLTKKDLVEEEYKRVRNNSLKDMMKSLTGYMASHINIEPFPRVRLIPNDKENSSSLFGRTAYYEPENKLICLYTHGRHPKDVLRSFAHEMIHHKQNLEGKLNEIYTTDTNEDSNLQTLEEEAYLKGNILFRNWEDSIKREPISEFEEKEQLNPEIFVDEKKIHPDLRERLLKIFSAFENTLKGDFEVNDVILVGSSVGYNYSEYSDIDLHLLVEPNSQVDREFLKDYYDSKKNNFNTKYDFKYKGHKIEAYIQFTDEPNKSNGVYSVLKDEWVKQPVKSNISVPEEDIQRKSEPIKKCIEQLESQPNLKDIYKLKDRIKTLRKSGLESGGEYSVENLAFKDLRNTDYLKRLSDLEVRETENVINNEPENN